MAEPSRTRTTGRFRNRERHQSRGRLRSEMLRTTAETVADPDVFEAMPGLGFPPSQGLSGSPEPIREIPAFTLRDILGSRPPLILLQIVRVDAEGVQSKLLAESGKESKEALAMFRQVVEGVFRLAFREDRLNADEWARLLGREASKPVDRRELLKRLAVAGETELPASDDPNISLTNTPNNVGLSCFAGKYAALPDGVPFSIRLLLAGRQKTGKFSDNPQMKDHPWAALSLDEQRLILVKALELEAEEVRCLAQSQQPWESLATLREDLGIDPDPDGKGALKDEEFRFLLLHAAEQLGYALKKVPVEKHVSMLRDKLKQKGEPDLFPSRPKRNAHFVAEYGKSSRPRRRRPSSGKADE